VRILFLWTLLKREGFSGAGRKKGRGLLVLTEDFFLEMMKKNLLILGDRVLL
jgi:hypothetical protein